MGGKHTQGDPYRKSQSWDDPHPHPRAALFGSPGWTFWLACTLGAEEALVRWHLWLWAKPL